MYALIFHYELLNIFILQYVTCEPGYFVTLDGSVVGRHSGRGIVLYHYYHSLLLLAGLPCYTIGQKTGLSLGNASYYVAKKNCHNNEITVVCDHWMYEKPITKPIIVYSVYIHYCI